MSLKDETPDTGRDAEGFKICLLTRAVERRRFNASKQYAVAMTSQVYTKTHNRNKNPALVSPKHCEYVPLIGGSTSKKPNQSCCTNRVTPRTTRQPNWNHVDRGNLVRHTVDTMMERAVGLT